MGIDPSIDLCIHPVMIHPVYDPGDGSVISVDLERNCRI